MGHTRAGQTKGIWLWGQPLKKQLPNGQDLNVVLIDTEGFESTGRSTAYGELGAVMGVEVLGIQPCSEPSQVKGACPAQASHSRSFPTFCIMSQTGPVVGCCLLPISTAALPLPLCHHPHFQSLPQPCTAAFPSRADDRIFAVSTLLSSLLIYNLPEAIRESDIAKLSFAVQLVRTPERREGEGVQPCLIHSLEAACRPPSCCAQAP